MKNVILLLIGAFAMTLSSCGTFAAYSSGSGQTFDDGIYSSGPSFGKRSENAESKKTAADLIQQTKESPMYLFGDRKDSISTSVTIADFNPYYTSYWDSPWYYNYYSSPWSYRGWYDPWYYNRYSWYYRYDPWYYNSWYGGWYGGFYDPYYHYMHPYYCGWYGGWDPHYGGIHHRPPYGGGHVAVSGREVFRGSRSETVGSRAVASVNRTPFGSISSVRRKTATTSRASFGTSRTASTRAAVGRGSTTSSRATSGSTTRSSTSNPSYNRSTTGNSSYDRSSSSSPSYNRSSNYNSGSSYNRSTSSSSSYNRGSSYNSGGSRSSGGGYSRSSSGGRR